MLKKIAGTVACLQDLSQNCQNITIVTNYLKILVL